MSSTPSARKQTDFMKMIMKGYGVNLINGDPQKFWITFPGPPETPYAGFEYKVHVELPDEYPFSSPSIGFEPRTVFHPNVDERSGSVCLDVINQTWTPMYSLVNVFDVFLPQLMAYPNAADPLNSEAALLYEKDRSQFNDRVKSMGRPIAETTGDMENNNDAREEKITMRKRSDVTDGDAMSISGASTSAPCSHFPMDPNSEIAMVDYSGDMSDLDAEFE